MQFTLSVFYLLLASCTSMFQSKLLKNTVFSFLILRYSIFIDTSIRSVFPQKKLSCPFHIFISNRTWLLMLFSYCSTSTTACKNVDLHSFVLKWFCTVLQYNKGFLLCSNCAIGKKKISVLLKFTNPRLMLCVRAQVCVCVWTVLDFPAYTRTSSGNELNQFCHFSLLQSCS